MKINNQKYLFITTSSLASNPRLVKEFECIKKSCLCYVICFKHHDWSLKLSEAIKVRNPEVHFIEIDRRQSTFETIKAKFLHKLSIFVNPLFQNHFKVCAFASNDKTPQLLLRLKKLRKQHQFDKVIAHNLGAFYPAVKLSKFQKIPLQLDIEDFYPGEALYFNKTYEKANRYCIMQTSFSAAETITYASKGIEIECKKAIKTNAETNHVTIINAFESSDFMKPQKRNDTIIKCIWFSQNIGPNRGLEQVFEAAKTNLKIEFHIIGNANEDYLKTKVLSPNIICHKIMSQTQLHQFLSTMDIGLALENRTADFNRDICLTNKFLAYAQAGLYIFATNTYGQRDFLNALHYKAGELITSNLSAKLSNFDKSVLNHENKLRRWENAKAFSWEKEQQKLVKLLN
jgi:glycosyltransferase involved in cell wall biosynthesis